MRIYETTFIVNPQADDNTIDSKVKAVTNLISNNGGKIIHENRIGTRRLAYTIQRLTQGYYTSLIFESESPVLPQLERHFKLDEAYIRYLTVLYEGDINKLKEPMPDVADQIFKRPEKDLDEDPRRGRREEPRERRRTEVRFETPARTVAPETVTKPRPAPAPEIPEAEDDTELSSSDDEEL
ncbi:MAG: 30S ribosomal protein S6 [Candidatus Zixiibacteriota bacterium]